MPEHDTELATADMSTSHDAALGKQARAGAPAHEPATALPFTANIDDADEPHDIVDALILTAFTSGGQPWSRSTRLSRVRSDAALLPPGARVAREAVTDKRESRLVTGEGWTLRTIRWRGGGGEATVTAVSEELARTVLEQATKDATAEESADSSVTMGFWYSSSRRGPYRTTRPIAAERWSAIRRNYSSAAAGALEKLMTVTRDNVAGRLVLLHGPPGTGKTTALRSLASEWRDWCQVDYVLDPEALFSDPSYLMEIVMGAEDDDDDDDDDGEDAGDRNAKRRWRLLVLEDCDELIRGEAKQSAGQALSRLLNLTDGLLGQGRNVLVAITTNEELQRLHPAVVRPGRCLAQVEIGALSYAEATAWLGTSEGVTSAMTLADLFALRNGESPGETHRPATGTGFYL